MALHGYRRHNFGFGAPFGIYVMDDKSALGQRDEADEEGQCPRPESYSSTSSRTHHRLLWRPRPIWII